MPAPVGRRAGQPSRVAGNARERRYSEAVALCRRHAPALGTSRTASRAVCRSGRSATWWTGVRSRRTLRLRASWAGSGQRARLLESLSRCLGSAGAVSSALPWVAQPPSEQCANSWRCGVALSTVGARQRRGGGCKILRHCKGPVSGARSLANGAADHGLTQIRVPLSCTFLACLTLRQLGGGKRSAFMARDPDDNGQREPPRRSPARVQSNG